MITAGIFELLSGSPISHAVLLFVGALVVAWDKAHRRPSTAAHTNIHATGPLAFARSVPLPIGMVLAAVYAAVVGGFARFSWPITVAIVVPGAAAIVAVWLDRSPRPTRPRISRAGLLAWTTVLVCLGLWELTQLLLQPGLRVDSYAHPTISVMLDPLLNTHRIDRSLGVFLWMNFGWFLMDR